MLELIELAGFAWGVYVWVAARHDKEKLRERQTIDSELLEIKEELKELSNTVNRMDKKIVALEVKTKLDRALNSAYEV